MGEGDAVYLGGWGRGGRNFKVDQALERGLNKKDKKKLRGLFCLRR